MSELLAQKIAEELNKKTLQGSSHDINDIVQEVAKNTASDDIFDDLCVEMYEEGFLSSFVLSPNKSRTPRKPVSPRKSFISLNMTREWFLKVLCFFCIKEIVTIEVLSTYLKSRR